VDSALAKRPYDLRHAAVSLCLNAGVTATEVARRAGHGVAVMLQVYTDCIDGEEQAYDDRITAALDGAGQAGTTTNVRATLGTVSASAEAEAVGVSGADLPAEEGRS
jgi:hypothetical protein